MIPTFSRNEIYVMLQTIGTEVLVGFSNPFAALNSVEIEAEWEKVYRSLHRRGLMELVDEEIILEERFGEALWIMSKTNVTVEIVTDYQRKSLFYFGEENVIECTVVGDDQYTLYMHGTPEFTWNNVIYPRMLAGVEERPVQEEKPIYIPATTYRDWVVRKRMPDSTELKQLIEHPDSKKVVKQLHSSIRQRTHNNRLLMFYKNNEAWSIEGVHILTSPAYNWVLKMVNKNGMELLETRQSSNLTIVIEVLDVLRRIERTTAFGITAG